MAINTPREVIHNQLAMNNANSVQGVEEMGARIGRNARTGEAAQVNTGLGPQNDLSEELGMAVATRGKADLQKMKLRKSAGANVEALGRIADYYDKLPALPSEQKLRDLVSKLDQFAEFMRRGEGGSEGMPTAEDIRALLAEYDGDITHQFAGLEDARQRMEAAGAPPALLALLDEVREELRLPDSARDIMAGFASAREASTVAERFGATPEDYRESYRQLLREPPQLGRTFDELRKFSLTENFDSVIDSFMKVAGDDMKSFGPSVEPVILNGVLKELSNLKNMRTVLETSRQTLGKIERMYPAGPEATRPGGEELASRLFHFAGGAISSMADAEGLVAGFEPDRPEVPVAAVNLLRDMHAGLPDAVMHSPSAREQQGRLLMALSDRLVEAEEALYD